MSCSGPPRSRGLATDTEGEIGVVKGWACSRYVDMAGGLCITDGLYGDRALFCCCTSAHPLVLLVHHSARLDVVDGFLASGY